MAPAGPFERSALDLGVNIISNRYKVRYDEAGRAQHRYLAGYDEDRFSELTAALLDPDIKAVFCARGGYGSMRLLPRLAAWAKDHRAPTKPLIGFSDITALHQWLQCRGIVSIHAPVLTQLGKLASASTETRLFSLLESTTPPDPLTGTDAFFDGTAEGPLLGGNLSVLTRLLGTPFMPALDGAILLLEDHSEQPYRLDRMWMHLELAGVFRRISGIVLGEFINCERRGASYSAFEVLRDLARDTGLPCACGFPIGHGLVNEPVPLGVHARLDAHDARLTFLEPAVNV